jgi:copper chaperone CopZ
MNFQKFIFTILVACFTLTSCNTKDKKEINTPVLAANKQQISLAISGMTCEIGCAKTIQSKLSKKEGVLAAKVVFVDGIANIEFDATKTSKKDLIAFVDGIAGGDLYTASDSSKNPHICADACKKDCEMKPEKTACKDDCKMACCEDKKA